MHPHTAQNVGFRVFDGSSFGELQETAWEFDGTAADVREFCSQNLGTAVSISEIGGGTFDAVLDDGTDVRIYTPGRDE